MIKNDNNIEIIDNYATKIDEGTKIYSTSDIEGDFRLLIYFLIRCGFIDPSKLPEKVRDLLKIDEHGSITDDNLKESLDAYYKQLKTIQEIQKQLEKDPNNNSLQEKLEREKNFLKGTCSFEIKKYLKNIYDYDECELNAFVSDEARKCIVDAIVKNTNNNVIGVLNGDILSLRAFCDFLSNNTKNFNGEIFPTLGKDVAKNNLNYGYFTIVSENKNCVCKKMNFVKQSYRLIVDILKKTKEKNGDKFNIIFGNHDMFQTLDNVSDYYNFYVDQNDFIDVFNKNMYDFRKELSDISCFALLYKDKNNEYYVYSHTMSYLNDIKNIEEFADFLNKKKK